MVDCAKDWLNKYIITCIVLLIGVLLYMQGGDDDNIEEEEAPTISQPESGNADRELLVEMSHPRYIPHQKRQEMEQHLYFIPTAIPGENNINTLAYTQYY